MAQLTGRTATLITTALLNLSHAQRRLGSWIITGDVDESKRERTTEFSVVVVLL